MGTEMAALQLAKKSLRAAMRQKLSQLAQDNIARQSNLIKERLLSIPEYKNAKRICVYLSMPTGEVSTRSIVYDAFQKGKEVYVPYTYKLESYMPDGPKSVMDMVSLDSVADYEALESDAWGIPTPGKQSIPGRKKCLGDADTASGDGPQDRADLESLDMIIMPGMAFDRGFKRLGHGKGFYDFFLQRYQQTKASDNVSSSKMPCLVGLALQEQVIADDQQIPTSVSDWPLDALIIGDGEILR